MNYDTWKTTPPEHSVIGKCACCDGDLYANCDYAHDRISEEWYCDDNCFLDHIRDNGDLVTEAIE